MAVAQAAVDVDGENGPLVVVRIGNRAVTVYLSLETGSLQSEEGSAVIQVEGNWEKFHQALREKSVRELGQMYDAAK